MYKQKSVFSGLRRHRRRNIISCLLLAAVLSVAFCGFFYRRYAQTQRAAVEARYANRCRLAFRDEL